MDELTDGLLNKILHHPIQALKGTAHRADGPERAQFFQEVFGLGEDCLSQDETPSAAVTTKDDSTDLC